ncbi:MAG: ankyrin repeat domain-containing protein, partial [Mucilaginibacter sp.]
RWFNWQEETGKNALHYLGGVDISKSPEKTGDSLQLLKLLLNGGMDINSIHNIPDANCNFPATPLWYAYTRGRNAGIYTYLLQNGANPDNCMYVIAWYDDVEAAELFRKHGAKVDDPTAGDTPFLAAFNWKRFSMAEWFLKNGANVNFTDSKGNTALFYAVKRKCKIEQVEMLLRFGADFNHENNEGLSPKKLAIINKQKKLSGLFIHQLS